MGEPLDPSFLFSAFIFPSFSFVTATDSFLCAKPQAQGDAPKPPEQKRKAEMVLTPTTVRVRGPDLRHSLSIPANPTNAPLLFFPLSFSLCSFSFSFSFSLFYLLYFLVSCFLFLVSCFLLAYVQASRLKDRIHLMALMRACAEDGPYGEGHPNDRAFAIAVATHGAKWDLIVASLEQIVDLKMCMRRVRAVQVRIFRRDRRPLPK